MNTTDVQGCEDALRLLAEHLDRELSASVSEQMERHLAKCRSCYSRAEFEAQLKSRIAALAREPVRPELAERVQKLIAHISY